MKLLFGVKKVQGNKKIVNKAKIIKKSHQIFNSFYTLNLLPYDEIDITETHNYQLNFGNVNEYKENMIIELNDDSHSHYLLIKKIGKGNVIYWNAGHLDNKLNDFEKKLFINFIYWIYKDNN